MKTEKDFPSRDELNEAFQVLQDQITRITVEEEQEMVNGEINGNNKQR